MENMRLSTGRHRKISSGPAYLLLSSALFLVFTVAVTMVTISTVQAGPIVRISEGDEWRYFKGEKDPPGGWNRSGYDYSGWQKGQSGFGYGKGNNRTHLGDMQGHYLTVYARHEFIAGKKRAVTMKMSAGCDDLFVAYLNGIEVIRGRALPVSEELDISGFAHELVAGENVLSVKCSNDDINSVDFSFIPVFEVTENGGAQ